MTLRKAAHVLVFALLAGLLYRALCSWPSPRQAGVFAWLLATIVAASDEIHQLLVPGRHGTLTDVVLDSAAAACAVLLLVRVTRLKRRTQPPS